jgi:F0F1-type ATP synthase epsilon subunit
MAKLSFPLTIVTPRGNYLIQTDEFGHAQKDDLVEQVASVTLPTTSGEIQILPGHSELVTLLGTGLLQYYLYGDSRGVNVSRPANLIVMGGSAQVRHDGSVVVIADEVELPRGDIGFIAARIATLREATQADSSLNIYQKVMRLHAAAERVEKQFQ